MTSINSKLLRFSAFRVVTLAILSFLLIGDVAQAQRGRGYGYGYGAGRWSGAAGDKQFAADRNDFHYLLANHDKIRRTVEMLPNGVQTLTESDDPGVTAVIQKHVSRMKVRVEKTQPIRMRDPLFAAIFKHADKIEFEYVRTEHGVRVKETSEDPFAVKLIQAHAEVLSAFVEHGFEEARKDHAVPKGDSKSAKTETLP